MYEYYLRSKPARTLMTSSGFSVGCCINREKVIRYQLEFGK